MARSGIIGSRAAWRWGLLLVTAAGVALTWGADQVWGGTAAGIIATVIFGIIAILVGVFANRLTSAAADAQPRSPAGTSSHVPPTAQPSPAELAVTPTSPRSAEPTTRDQRLDFAGYSGPLPESDDLLDSRNSLVECLASSIPDGEYIEQVADEAGLDRRHLKLGGTPSNSWSSVIRRAEVEGKEQRVVERASRISPDQALRQAIQDYIGRRA
jgi:hypothetical protein